jgi:hypothetical protein
MRGVNLAQLIESRKKAGAGSLRDMERRAADAGTPISRTSLGDYANGKQTAFPNEDARRAIAAAIDSSYEVVTAAALESAAPQVAGDGRTLQRAEAWLKLTEGRSDEEVQHLLGVVAAALKGWDSTRHRG